ncbi:hypothetical protein EV702DRAFT_1205252 [Suillus placidus]|uniref:Uncharacterized protein n=1 Tax=Suillus placidus TaxID=48579 RepID=A0A9P6ZFM0_9AGAM|nr:hypothetical protein EV702DRAFT_1205252 [Suillus placidus]
MSAGCITNNNLFLIGDIFLTIVRSGLTVSIAVLRSTLLSLNNISRVSIETGVMQACQMTAKITGQLLTIILSCPPPNSPQQLLWNGGYVKAHSVVQGTSGSISTDHVIIITVSGSLVEPINPEPTFLRLRDDINTDDFMEINGGQSTWQVSQSTLQAACELLWSKVVEIKVTLKGIASVTPSDIKTFPYQLSDGKQPVGSLRRRVHFYMPPLPH